MEEEKVLNVTQLQVVDKIQAEDVILLIRDTGNGKQCFQIKGSDFRGESAYEAALKQGFVGTYQDWTQHIKEITKYKSKPKTQYIIGKSIPIGKLDGGTRLNAYIVRSGNFRFKLSHVPQLRKLIRSGGYIIHEVDNLLRDVTWHIFINDVEVCTCKTTTLYGGHVLYADVERYRYSDAFFKLDESKSSVDLSSDMYIYLRKVLGLPYEQLTFKGTSKTLFYFQGVRIWKPFESPFINFGNVLYNSHGGTIVLQKLHTSQKRSKKSGSRENFSVRKYRGYCDSVITRYGFYRYRLIKNCKTTQWRTISIMRSDMGNFYIK